MQIKVDLHALVQVLKYDVRFLIQFIAHPPLSCCNVLGPPIMIFISMKGTTCMRTRQSTMKNPT